MTSDGGSAIRNQVRGLCLGDQAPAEREVLGRPDRARPARIFVGKHAPRFHVVLKQDRQNARQDSRFVPFVEDREHDFDASAEVPRHPVGAGDVNIASGPSPNT